MKKMKRKSVHEKAVSLIGLKSLPRLAVFFAAREEEIAKLQVALFTLDDALIGFPAGCPINAAAATTHTKPVDRSAQIASKLPAR